MRKTGLALAVAITIPMATATSKAKTEPNDCNLTELGCELSKEQIREIKGRLESLGLQCGDRCAGARAWSLTEDMSEVYLPQLKFKGDSGTFCGQILMGKGPGGEPAPDSVDVRDLAAPAGSKSLRGAILKASEEFRTKNPEKQRYFARLLSVQAERILVGFCMDEFEGLACTRPDVVVPR